LADERRVLGMRCLRKCFAWCSVEEQRMSEIERCKRDIEDIRSQLMREQAKMLDDKLIRHAPVCLALSACLSLHFSQE